MGGSAKGPRLCCWLIFVVLLIIMSCFVPPLLSETGSNKIAGFFYILIFILFLLSIVVWPCCWCPADPGCCGCLAAVAIGPGSVFLLFGSGTYYSLANGAEGTGSIASVLDLLSAQPRPTKLYFTDGYIAKSFTTSKTWCQEEAKTLLCTCTGTSVPEQKCAS